MPNRAMIPETVAPPLGAYSHAVEIAAGARVMHLAGQVGIAKDGSVPADFRAQAELAWANCVAILVDNGMTLNDVVKINHFITRPDDIPEYAAIRPGLLGDARPASTLLVVAGLARPDLLIEVEMIAAKTAG